MMSAAANSSERNNVVFSKNNDDEATCCARNNRDCFFDIELASLSRLENVVGALVRRLLHERDVFERRCVSLRLTVSSRYESTSSSLLRRRRQNDTEAPRFDLSDAMQHRRNTVPPLVISRVRIDSRVSKVEAPRDIFERIFFSSSDDRRRVDVSSNAATQTLLSRSKNSAKIDEFIAHVCDRDDSRSMERAGYAIDVFRKVVDASTTIPSATATVAVFPDDEKNSSTSTTRRRCCDTTDRALWFLDKFDALVRATAELTAAASSKTTTKQ